MQARTARIMRFSLPHDPDGRPWRVARPHCCDRAPSEPCVRVVPAHGSSKPREDPLPQTPYVTLDPLPVDRQPRQGLALRSVRPRRSRGVQLVLRFPRRCHGAPSPAHLTHVGALSGRGTRPRIRPVPSRQPLGGAARCLLVLSPFGAPALACWVILRPLGLCAFLTVGLPSQARTPSGLPRCPRARSDRDGCPLYSGVRCPHGRHRHSGRRWPPPSGPPLYPGAASTLPGLGITKRRQGFTRVHPSGLPHCL